MMNTPVASLRKMNGNVLVIVTLSLLLIVGMAGLAIDLGHSFSNKTRLQNSVDAAALSAAMKLLEDLQDNLGSNTPVTTAAANSAGSATHRANLTSFGGTWLPGEFTTPTIQFCWSTNLQDFSNCQEIANFSALTPEASAEFYVRARVATTPLANFFMRAVGMGNTRSVGAVAVAGTSGNIYDCNVAPFFVCDKSGTTPADSNCSDGSCFGNPVTLDSDTAVDPSHFFALKVGADNPPATPVSSCPLGTALNTTGCLVVSDLRVGTVDDPTTTNINEAVNGFPVVINKATQADWDFNSSITLNGNFGYLELIDVNGGNTNPGAPGMKYNLLQSNACIENNSATTQTGNISSLDAAFNALFGDPKPPYSTNGNPMPLTIDHYADFLARGTFYPGPYYPDVITGNIYNPISFNFYRLKYLANAAWNPPLADDVATHYHQRLRNIPVLDCPNPMNGNLTNIPVKGHACFFFNRKMYGSGEDGRLINNEDWVIAEHVDNKHCPPVLGVGQSAPTSILDANVILYQYYESADS